MLLTVTAGSAFARFGGQVGEPALPYRALTPTLHGEPTMFAARFILNSE
ncbi:hypothetical protein [Luteitalea sp.]